MIRNTILTLVIIIATVFTVRWLLNSPETYSEVAGHDEQMQDFPRGAHNGRLLQEGSFALEITIFESGVPPEFHIYPYFQDQAINPETVNLELELGRTGNVVDQFEFASHGDYLRGNIVVAEPHSFDVTVTARYKGKNYRWTYDSYEGRTQIATELASEAGVKTEIAGPAMITESLSLTGRVEIDPNRLSQVRPRFPGVVQGIHVELGTMIKAGQRMLTVQSNESLQNYSVKAPISGLVIKRNVQVGEATSEDPLFTIVDLSRVWVELDIFAKDVGKVKEGQVVTLETLDGFTTEGVIDWLAPLSSHASQSIHARVPLDNPDGRLRPGQFVRAEVGIAEHEVPLAVKRTAVQPFRDFQVVFAKFGETYEVRMLEFGLSNDEWLEVVGGLAPGREYVTENSYLIKADIEKSGASHDH
jgi:membrane fusion protein, heavy metal efflux system